MKTDDLPICRKCGWYDGYTHSGECAPALGRKVDDLRAAFKVSMPEVTVTKLGYGFGKVTCLVSKGCALTLHAYKSGFRVDGMCGLFWMRTLGIRDVVALVRKIREIDVR